RWFGSELHRGSRVSPAQRSGTGTPEANEERVMGRRLYVGNLPYTTGEAELQELFSKAGTVESVRVMRDAATGRARGFAFVEMSTDEEAQKAASELNQFQMGGRALTVNEARPKPEGGFGGAGGGFGGKPGGARAVWARVWAVAAAPGAAGVARGADGASRAGSAPSVTIEAR